MMYGILLCEAQPHKERPAFKTTEFVRLRGFFEPLLFYTKTV